LIAINSIGLYFFRTTKFPAVAISLPVAARLIRVAVLRWRRPCLAPPKPWHFKAMQGFRDGKVFVFEPSPEHINVIALDIDQNLLEDRVFIVPNGLGEFTNPVQGIDSLLSAIADTGNSVANVEDAAPILALEDFLPLQGIDRRDCIKLDVEGFELKALKGAAAALKVYRPRLGFRCTTSPRTSSKSRSISRPISRSTGGTWITIRSPATRACSTPLQTRWATRSYVLHLIMC
jgi:FkbM family methyltransferase